MDEKELEQDILEENIIDDDEDDDDDIEFDDNINVEAITQQLQEHIDIEVPPEEEMALPEVETSGEVYIETEEPKEVSPLDNFPKDICKKYVVYIRPENVDFVDNLSIDERNHLINKVIYDQHIADKKVVVLNERKRYIQHLVIVCITIILGFPLLFFVVNKSLQASITNYEQSQKNFEKLYKEKGKITNYQKLEAEQ